MAVEIRQMVVKSNVLQRQQEGGGESSHLSSQDRQAILAECRNLVLEVLREVKER